MNLRRAAILVITSVMAFSAVLGNATAGPSPTSFGAESAPIATADYCADSEEQAFLKHINDYRLSQGLPTLAMSQSLGAAAKHHSIDMATKNYFSHTLSDGTSWSQNITNHGYPTNTYRAENIAAGNALASATFTQWRNSSGHNANMLGSNYKAIGIGRAYDANSQYKWYWTTTFGSVVDSTAKLCGSGSSSPPPTSTPVPTPTTAPSTGSSSGTVHAIARSSRSSGSNSPTYAYDNRPTTAWHTTATRPPQSAWVSFDLGSVKSISSINWMFSQTGGADAMLIQVSNDGRTWTTVASRGNATPGAWHSLNVKGSARHVRFFFNNPNNRPRLGYLAEVRIMS